MTRRVLSVVGARPNFMKLAPLAQALYDIPDIEHLVVHTGQHYDIEMSEAFFRDLDIEEPDRNLEVGSDTHARQTAAIMERFERVCDDVRPDAVLVYGDVNSTVAAALVAAKLGIRVGHVEAGLRSRDWSMPEEINRVVTDRLSDWLFTPSRDGDENLLAEGVPAERIHFVGNIMIDTLVRALPRARESKAAERLGVAGKPYALTTMHRPSNVDDPEVLAEVMGGLSEIAKDVPVVFPVHPRTRSKLDELCFKPPPGVKLVDPVGYLDMLSLQLEAALVVTDSGGLQEESTYLGIPCVTVRPNTERPITCTKGTNRLVSSTCDAILAAAREALSEGRRETSIEGWDGAAAGRIVDVLVRELT